MGAPDPRFVVVGIDEVDDHRGRVTHIVSIGNPGCAPTRPAWFRGEHLQLRFGDVVSEADARKWRTMTPTPEDIGRAVEFFRAALRDPGSRVLFHCEQGASRSPALAYVCVADQLGAGREAEALDAVLAIRPEAIPNRLVVTLGDAFLARRGALLGPLALLYRRLDEELSG